MDAKKMKLFVARNLLQEINARVMAHNQGGQRIVADELGFTASYLNDVLHGKRGISDELARRLGYRKLTVFVRDGKPE